MANYTTTHLTLHIPSVSSQDSQSNKDIVQKKTELEDLWSPMESFTHLPIVINAHHQLL